MIPTSTPIPIHWRLFDLLTIASADWQTLGINRPNVAQLGECLDPAPVESGHLPQQQDHCQPNWCERGCGCPVWSRAGVRGSTRLPTSLCITIFLVALLNLLVYITGAGYNTSVEDKEPTVLLVLSSGIIFFFPVLTLIRISWTACSIIPDTDKHLGWAASASG